MRRRLWICGTETRTGLLSNPQIIHEQIWSIGGMRLGWRSRNTRTKTCPSVTSSIKNPIWTDLGANWGLRGEKPATNGLSYDTANESFNLIPRSLFRDTLQSFLTVQIVSERSFGMLCGHGRCYGQVFPPSYSLK